MPKRFGTFDTNGRACGTSRVINPHCGLKAELDVQFSSRWLIRWPGPRSWAISAVDRMTDRKRIIRLSRRKHSESEMLSCRASRRRLVFFFCRQTLSSAAAAAQSRSRINLHRVLNRPSTPLDKSSSVREKNAPILFISLTNFRVNYVRSVSDRDFGERQLIIEYLDDSFWNGSGWDSKSRWEIAEAELLQFDF